MYNLVVAYNTEAWNGAPYFLEIDRCISEREYTEGKITEKYADLLPFQINEILRFPCIFAYEAEHKKDPKFGFIREIVKRQGQVRISYEIINLDKFLKYSDFLVMKFELDIGNLELSRTHWAIKNVDLQKELIAKGIKLPIRDSKDEYRESAKGERVEIFFCYAHEDETLLNKLKAHLRPLQRQGLINFWHDRDISAGTEWEKEISQRLNEAQIILLLISPDFMNSDYCYGREMKKALERHERGEVRVIPIILRPCYWRITGLNELQALPTDAVPVISSKWHNLDEALYDVVEGIRKAAEKLISEQPLPGQEVSLKMPLLEPARETERIIPAIKIQGGDNQKALYQLFFADLLERLKAVRPGITNAKKTQQERFWWFGAGKTGYIFIWAFTKEGLKTGLIINILNNRDATKKAFDTLYEQRAYIEKEFGQSLVWERRPEGKESHIFLIRPATISDSSEKLEQTKIWAVETMLKFADVFQKPIKMV